MVAAGLTGGITQGVTGELGLNGASGGLGNATANQMARAAIQSTVGQGVNVALGLQDRFSWSAVAAAAISAPLADAIGSTVGGAVGGEFGKTAGLIAGSLAYGFTHQAVTTALAGGKVTAANVASDAFGNLLGSAQTWQMRSAADGVQSVTATQAYADGSHVAEVAPLESDRIPVQQPVYDTGEAWVADLAQRRAALNFDFENPVPTAYAQAPLNASEALELARWEAVGNQDGGKALGNADFSAGDSKLNGVVADAYEKQVTTAGWKTVPGTRIYSDSVGTSVSQRIADQFGYNASDIQQVGASTSSSGAYDAQGNPLSVAEYAAWSNNPTGKIYNAQGIVISEGGPATPLDITILGAGTDLLEQVNNTLSGAVEQAQDYYVQQGAKDLQNGNMLGFLGNGFGYTLAELSPRSVQQIAADVIAGPLIGKGLQFAMGAAVRAAPILGRDVGALFGQSGGSETQALIRAQIETNIAATRAGNASSNIASFLAKSDQIASGYAADTWSGTTLKQGSVVYALRPGTSAYFTDLATVQGARLDSYSLTQALQVKPHDIYGYRPDVTGFRVVQDLFVPGGQALANPAFGPGGGTQFFIQNAGKYLEPITTIRLFTEFIR